MVRRHINHRKKSPTKPILEQSYHILIPHNICGYYQIIYNLTSFYLIMYGPHTLHITQITIQSYILLIQRCTQLRKIFRSFYSLERSGKKRVAIIFSSSFHNIRIYYKIRNKYHNQTTPLEILQCNLAIILEARRYSKTDTKHCHPYLISTIQLVINNFDLISTRFMILKICQKIQPVICFLLQYQSLRILAPAFI